MLKRLSGLSLIYTIKWESLFIKTIHILLNILLKSKYRIIIAVYKYNDFFLFSIIFLRFFPKNNNLLKFRYFLLEVK